MEAEAVEVVVEEAVPMLVPQSIRSWERLGQHRSILLLYSIKK